MTKPMTMTSGQWPETQDNQWHWWWRRNNYDESEQIDKNEPTSAIISRNSSSPASHSCWTSSPPGGNFFRFFPTFSYIFLVIGYCQLFQQKQDLQWRMIDDRRLVLYNSPNKALAFAQNPCWSSHNVKHFLEALRLTLLICLLTFRWLLAHCFYALEGKIRTQNEPQEG